MKWNLMQILFFILSELVCDPINAESVGFAFQANKGASVFWRVESCTGVPASLGESCRSFYEWNGPLKESWCDHCLRWVDSTWTLYISSCRYIGLSVFPSGLVIWSWTWVRIELLSLLWNVVSYPSTRKYYDCVYDLVFFQSWPKGVQNPSWLEGRFGRGRCICPPWIRRQERPRCLN